MPPRSPTIAGMTSPDLQATIAHMGTLARAASRGLAASPVAVRNAALRTLARSSHFRSNLARQLSGLVYR